MKNCEQSRKAYPFLDGELPEADAGSFATHAEDCGECADVLRHAEDLSLAFDSLRNVSPNPVAVQKIHAAIGTQNSTPVISIFRFAAAAAAVVALCCGILSYAVSSSASQGSPALMEIAAYAQAEAYSSDSGDENSYIALMVSEHQGVSYYE